MFKRPTIAVIALSCAALFTTANANAADLGGYRGGSIKDEPLPGPPMMNWTGFYVGAHLGGSFGGDDEIKTTGQVAANQNNVNGGARPARVSLDKDSVIGGGQIGYNVQTGGIVFGVEADISATGQDEQVRVVTTALNGVDRLANDFSSSLNYFGTVRGRLGVAVDRTLFFATAGLAYGEVESSVNMFGPAGQLQFSGSKSDVLTGYVVGGGIEHAFTSNLILKAEYLYYDLGDQTVAANVIPGSGGGGTGYISRFENDGHIVRAGLNYKF
jgi:outer membrane immunogenic protein